MENSKQKPKIIINQEDQSILIELNKEIYHRDAVLKASNKFSEDFYIRVTPIDEYTVGVIFKRKDKGNVNLENEALQFCNTVLDQQIREDLTNSNGSIRNIIYTHAFSPIKDLQSALK